MKKVLVILLLLCSGFTFSQSVYSQYGVGSLVKSNSVRQSGLGGQGVSLSEADAFNSLNPASLSIIDVTRMEFSASANFMSIKDSKQSKYYSQGFFNGFSLAFPVYKPWGIGTALGIQPYSTINYEIRKSATDANIGTYTEKFTGSGGISKFFWSTSYILPYAIQFGFTYNYYFGRSEYLTELAFNQSSYVTGKFSSRYDVKGSGVTLGLISPELNKYFGLQFINSLKAGFVLDVFSKLPTDYEFVSASTYSEDTISTTVGKTELPLKFTFGISTQLKNKMFVSLDYSAQKWSDYKRMGSSDIFMRDMQRVSLGISTRSYRESGIDYEKPVYRFGVSYEQTPLKIKGNDINELSASVGMSVPLGWKNYIETAVTYTMRGTTNSGLVKENIFKVEASLNMGELWFIQQER